MGQGPLQTCGQPTHDVALAGSGAASNEEVLVDPARGPDAIDCGSPGSPQLVSDHSSQHVSATGSSQNPATIPQTFKDRDGETHESFVRTSSSGSYLPPSEIERLVGDDLCAICLEPLHGRAQTIAFCGHIFHRVCLNRCGNGLCPKCRMPIDGPLAQEGQSAQGDAQNLPAANASLQVAAGLLAVGTSVVIHSLQNHTELNGTRGRVVHVHEMANRYEVRATATGQLFRVKAENLMPAELTVTPTATPRESELAPAPGELSGSQLRETAEEGGSRVARGGSTTSLGRASASSESRRLATSFEPGTVALTGVLGFRAFDILGPMNSYNIAL
jgi:hypothetical protein